MSDNEEEQGHGPTDCAHYNENGEIVIFCACGFMAHGDTWGEAVDSMDCHLAEVDES